MTPRRTWLEFQIGQRCGNYKARWGGERATCLPLYVPIWKTPSLTNHPHVISPIHKGTTSEGWELCLFEVCALCSKTVHKLSPSAYTGLDGERFISPPPPCNNCNSLEWQIWRQGFLPDGSPKLNNVPCREWCNAKTQRVVCQLRREGLKGVD